MTRAIRVYKKFFSPAFHAIFASNNLGCRFYPSCSEYTIEAINKYGTRRGLWRGFKRILRCQPLATGGFDPVN